MYPVSMVKAFKRSLPKLRNDGKRFMQACLIEIEKDCDCQRRSSKVQLNLTCKCGKAVRELTKDGDRHWCYSLMATAESRARRR